MEIKISKCATLCGACEEAFEHEQKVHSIVRVSEDAMQRHDFCPRCVPAEKDEAVFCAWETQFNDPKIVEAERQENLSPLRRLFYDLADSSERIGLAQAFLAAQLLKRQKAFRQIRESEEGEGAARVTLFLDRAGNRLIETRDLQFTYAELDDARTGLLERLRILEAPEPPPESDAETVAPSLPGETPGAPPPENGDTSQ